MIKSNDLPIVSVIIVNYNGEPFIQKLFESLSKQSFDTSKFEIIFVDNNSKDRSLEIMNEIILKYPSLNIKVIKNKSNVGFCRGNNIGMLYAKGKYLALLNNDMYVDSSYLEKLVNALENDASIGICGSREILRDDHGGTTLCLGNHFGIFRIRNKFSGIVRSNDLVEGFFMLVVQA
jgi:GT2 family glycosyltransferase